MNRETIDWKALEQLRAAFLAGTAGTQDYWRSDADLASYDATFAQRIGWKWDWVLDDLDRLGWSPPAGELLDWGCGSGIAHRALLDHFGTATANSLHLWDRSSRAVQFAADKAGSKYPGLTVQAGRPDSPALLLISHVLSELDEEQSTQLADFAAQATAVIWVEPGNYESSLALIAVRERLRDRINVIAPCTHRNQCGILSPGNERHWCHHFAEPPRGVFMDGNWARFAKLAGVDLRSLPLSYLVLDKRSLPTRSVSAVRVIGKPRVYKAHALLLSCDSSGVAECRLDKRVFPDEFRKVKKGRFGSLRSWTSQDGVIREM